MLHKNVTVGDNHVIHNWTVANTAARLALTLLPADQGKLAWQTDTNIFYFLVDSAVPTWIAAVGVPGPTGATGAAGTNAPKILPVAVSDEVTALTAGVAKVTFRMPYAMTLSAVRASLTTAQATGASLLTVDIKESGISILSTKLSIDNTEKTSTTAAVPVVISDTVLADDAEITIDINLIGDGTAKGLKVYLIGS